MSSLTNHNKSIEEYISSCPESIQNTLRLLQKTIREEIPNAEETISYGVPTFKVNGNYVVYFAGYKEHISLYPIFDALLEGLGNEDTYKKTGKGTMQFPFDQPLPLSLIRKIVKRLLLEHQKRGEKK